MLLIYVINSHIIHGFEPQLDNFWCSHYKTIWRSYGNSGQAYLKDFFIDYIDIKINDI